MRFYKLSNYRDKLYPEKATDKNKMKFYNFLKSKNIKVAFYHGTCTLAWELMRKNKWMTPPSWRGRQNEEARFIRNPDNISSVNKLFFTKNIGYAYCYAEREKESWYGKKDLKKQFDIENVENKPLIIEITVPIHELDEVKGNIFGTYIYNETGYDNIFKNIINNEESFDDKLKAILTEIEESSNRNSEFTIKGGVPLNRESGFENVKSIDINEYITKNIEIINKYIEEHGFPHDFAEEWAKKQLNSSNPPEKWIEAICKSIEKYGDPTDFAIEWVLNQLNSPNPPEKLIESINKYIETKGYPPEFAYEWVINQINSENPPEKLIEAINNYIRRFKKVPEFVKEWYEKNKLKNQTATRISNWYKKSKNDSSSLSILDNIN